jgi:outer membrane protein assembly factor BamB
MKKISLIKYLTPILLIGVFLSCEPGDIVPSNTKNIVSATIDSKSFVSGSVSANLYAVDLDSNLEIYAKSTTNNVVILNLTSLKEGAYSHGSEPDPTINFVYKESINGGNTFSENSLSGNLIVTKHDVSSKTVSGTFNFITSSHSIQSGKFSQVPY